MTSDKISDGIKWDSCIIQFAEILKRGANNYQRFVKSASKLFHPLPEEGATHFHIRIPLEPSAKWGQEIAERGNGAGIGRCVCYVKIRASVQKILARIKEKK